MTQVSIAPTCAGRGDLREYAEWLQGVPWQLFCTLTFAWPVSDWRAPQVFKAFMNRLERSFRYPIVCLRGDEKRASGCGKPATPRHFHVMFAVAVRLDATFIENTWMLMAGFRANGAGAEVCAYDPKGNAIVYCLRFIFQPEGDWDFKNLDLYLCPPNAMNRNRRQRRRLARNAKRMLEASQSAPLPVCDKNAADTLAHLMSLCQQRKADVVIVWKLDRLGRSLKHLVNILAEWVETGCHVVFCSD
jgi:Resolvase, N terminal domain